jgi:hypothetical protein
MVLAREGGDDFLSTSCSFLPSGVISNTTRSLTELKRKFILEFNKSGGKKEVLSAVNFEPLEELNSALGAPVSRSPTMSDSESSSGDPSSDIDHVRDHDCQLDPPLVDAPKIRARDALCQEPAGSACLQGLTQTAAGSGQSAETTSKLLSISVNFHGAHRRRRPEAEQGTNGEEEEVAAAAAHRQVTFISTAYSSTCISLIRLCYTIFRRWPSILL